jgi:flagellar biosynthesis protein
MVSLLMQVDLDTRIPPQLYQAVAELLAWLHRLESGAGDDAPGAEPATVAGTTSGTPASGSGGAPR